MLYVWPSFDQCAKACITASSASIKAPLSHLFQQLPCDRRLQVWVTALLPNLTTAFCMYGKVLIIMVTLAPQHDQLSPEPLCITWLSKPFTAKGVMHALLYGLNTLKSCKLHGKTSHRPCGSLPCKQSCCTVIEVCQ